MANCLFLISLVPETLFLCYTDAQTDDNEPPRGRKRELVITACRRKLRIAIEENPLTRVVLTLLAEYDQSFSLCNTD